MKDAIRVVAGVLRDAHGRVLVAQRPAGRHLAGFWEFPGGKIEAGETPADALRRELAEELGIDVESAAPLIRVPHEYPEKRVELDVWTVDAYSGIPHAREHEALCWASIDELRALPMPPADVPVVTALRLPDRYLITPDVDVSERGALLDGIARTVARGVRLIQLRQTRWPRDALASVAAEARHLCARSGAELLVNGDAKLAVELALAGVHLPAREAAALDARPVPASMWLAVSCHDAEELRQAERIGADFAVLSPVNRTPSHPDRAPLGWERFADLANGAALPVYALGGGGLDELELARRSGAQGIAAIRALWK